jgi:predicted dinucleotide-binding enzyme
LPRFSLLILVNLEVNIQPFFTVETMPKKAIAAQLIQDCGYDAIDAGGLMVSRSLETLATAWVQFAVVSNLFPNVGLKALRR